MEKALPELWEKVPNWNAHSFTENKSYSYRVYVDAIKMAAKKQSLAPMWHKLMKYVDIQDANIIS